MSEKEIKVLIFSINNEFYATDIMEVERIVGYQEPTKLPDSPIFVEGVMNHEGSILPIISLAKRFGLPLKEGSKDSKIIVAKQGVRKIGIIVDVVSEVRDINVDSIENPPEIMSGISKRYMKGLIKLDKIIIFLNLAAILSEEERAVIL